jgi:oligoendopeptidase F
MQNLENVTWDLSALYKSSSDKKIKSDLDASKKLSLEFRKNFSGKLPKKANLLLPVLKQFEEIEEKASLPLIYASLLFAQSATEKNHGAFLQNMREEYNEIRKNLIFFELEISSFSSKELKSLASDKLLKNYKHYLNNILINKPYRLSKEVEEILADKEMAGRSAWIRLFDEEFANKKFEYLDPTIKKQKIELLSETSVLTKLYNPNRKIRIAAAESLTKGLRDDSRRLAYIFNCLLLDKKSDDHVRKYPSAETSRHLANEISNTTVEAMCQAAESNFSVVQRYYKLKAKKLNLSKLYDYDRYAPISKDTTLISANKAKDLVLEAFYDFSDIIGEIAEEFFRKNWIDFADRSGKRGGAFCSFVTPSKHPVVFMNYHGSMRDVFTLAHELGHAIHAYLMRSQNLVNFDTPLTIAETASVFAEMLLFEKLNSSDLNKQQRFSLYAGKLENIFATVFRQISMYRFEQDLHHNYRKSGELSVEQINHYWKTRQQKMFDSSVELTQGYDWWWSYISHFVHSPFYVYSYAFGELLTLSLYEIYKKDPVSFIPKYIEMLATGGSKTPDELMKPFGVDLNSKSFWLKGIKIIDKMVDKAAKI